MVRAPIRARFGQPYRLAAVRLAGGPAGPDAGQEPDPTAPPVAATPAVGALASSSPTISLTVGRCPVRPAWLTDGGAVRLSAPASSLPSGGAKRSSSRTR